MQARGRSTRGRLVAGIVAVALVATVSNKADALTRATGSPKNPPSCGPTLYKSTGEPWQCTFDDEFSGTELDASKWTPMVTAKGGYWLLASRVQRSQQTRHRSPYQPRALPRRP